MTFRIGTATMDEKEADHKVEEEEEDQKEEEEDDEIELEERSKTDLQRDHALPLSSCESCRYTLLPP